MRLCTYSRGGERRIGFLVDDNRLLDLAETAARVGVSVPEAADLRELCRVEHLPALAELQRAAAADPDGAMPVGDVTLHAPFRPRQNIICAGGNTRDERSSERIRNGKPWLTYFSKAPSAVNDPGAPISWPVRLTSMVYAEPQLAVVLGARTSYVDPEDVLDRVFGYAVATSVSSDDLKRKHGQWDKAVSLDTFFCWGPVIVTADDVDVSQLALRLWLNDRMAISAGAESGLLTTAQVLSEISYGMQLLAGDVVLTGVGESIGHGLQPERWLQDGDVVRSQIDGLGTIENPVATT
jgi:2-keto-4-pentenoate hydratase/2-oxohepta-3-ene-1,7-dioic acid hydratase in catechol pathway